LAVYCPSWKAEIDPELMVEFIILELAVIDQALLISVVDVHSVN